MCSSLSFPKAYPCAQFPWSICPLYLETLFYYGHFCPGFTFISFYHFYYSQRQHYPTASIGRFGGLATASREGLNEVVSVAACQRIKEHFFHLNCTHQKERNTQPGKQVSEGFLTWICSRNLHPSHLSHIDIFSIR